MARSRIGSKLLRMRKWMLSVLIGGAVSSTFVVGVQLASNSSDTLRNLNNSFVAGVSKVDPLLGMKSLWKWAFPPKKDKDFVASFLNKPRPLFEGDWKLAGDLSKFQRKPGDPPVDYLNRPLVAAPEPAISPNEAEERRKAEEDRRVEELIADEERLEETLEELYPTRISLFEFLTIIGTVVAGALFGGLVVTLVSMKTKYRDRLQMLDESLGRKVPQGMIAIIYGLGSLLIGSLGIALLQLIMYSAGLLFGGLISAAELIAGWSVAGGTVGWLIAAIADERKDWVSDQIKNQILGGGSDVPVARSGDS